jgi:hypothetical protein
MGQTMTRDIWKWYVYELVDPRTDTVFYVGKGTGNRMHNHEREAAKGVCSEKTSRINEITCAGLNVGKRKVAVFWDEQAAYDHEADRIVDYGLESLTNAIPGGGTAWDRKHEPKPEEIIPLYDWLVANEHRMGTTFFLFAEWYRAGCWWSGKRVIVPENINHPLPGILQAVMDFIPTFWKCICGCSKSLEWFAVRMRPYGLEVSHGCSYP